MPNRDEVGGASSLEIQTATRDDASTVLDIYAPFVTDSAVSFEEEPPTTGEMGDRIAHSHVWLLVDDALGTCGYAYAAPFHPRPAYRWSTEVSIYLAARAQGRGIGKALLAELIKRLVAGGFVNAFAGTTLPNPGSVALFESFGFTKVAHQNKVGFKHGAWHDVGWWQLQLQEPTMPPPAIRASM